MSEPVAGFEDQPEHMRPLLSNRGFKYMPVVEVDYDGRFTAHESSSADGPALWMNAVMKKHPGDPRSEKISVSLLVSLDRVDMIIDQLKWLRDNHYQRPEGERYPTAEDEAPWWHQ